LKRPTAETERRLDEIREQAKELQPKQSYHNLPLLKPPVWTWEIPVYFFVGGAAGAAAVIAVAAQVTGTNARLVRDARRIAAIGAALSAPLLIADLGRPERFLHMLRVFKIRSPMSVGAWTVAVFGGAATVSGLSDSVVGDAASLLAGATGLVMATYTGVLLGATAIPLWAEHARLLPVHFGASALGSAVSLLELRRHDDTALNILALGAAIFETLTGVEIEGRDDRGSEPVRHGPTGTLTRVGGVLSGPIPLALRLLGLGSKRARQAAAVSTLLGSLITRFAWVEAGKVSARDIGVAMTPNRA
jgi:hypothetical protein